MVVQEDIRFPAHDARPMLASFALPAGASWPRPAVLVLHEAFGLNTDIRRIAAKFADAGYVALAPDLLDGSSPRVLCLAQALRDLGRGEGRTFQNLEAARLWLGERPEVDASRIGVAGFCMGGSFATLLAVRAPYGVAAPFYGAVPKSSDALLGSCPVVASYGGKDRIFMPHARRLEKHLQEIGIEHDFKVYPEVGHSFMNQTNGILPRIMSYGPMQVGYNADAADDAWTRMLAFFAKHLDA